MNILLHYWAHSLREIFSLASLIRFGQAFVRYFSALKLFAFHFGLLVLLDCVISLYFGKDFFQILVQAVDGKNEAPMSMLVLHMMSGITWFIIGAGLFILIRLKKQRINMINYIRTFLFRYVQLSLVFSLILFFFLLCIINFGITKIPMPHWSLILFIRSVELITMFYWLDSHFTPKDILISFERGINFFVYNLPFFCFIMTFMYLSDYVIKLLLLQAGLPEAIGFNFSFLKSNNVTELKNFNTETISMIRVIGFKYIKFLIDYFWIVCAFLLYNESKNISYTHSFFDTKKLSDNEKDND